MTKAIKKSYISINSKLQIFLAAALTLMALTASQEVNGQNDPSLLDMGNFLAGEVTPQTPLPKDLGNQENLDLYSGKLKTAIPLLNLKGRGETSINISNVIQTESMSGYFYVSCCPETFTVPLSVIYTSSLRTYYNRLLRFGPGYGPGVVYSNWSAFTSPVNASGLGVNFPSLPRRPVNLTFVGPDGMTIMLRDAEIIREVKYTNQGVYVGNAHQYRNIGDAGKVYLSTDNNGTRFTADSILAVPGGGTGSFWADINNEAYGVPGVLPNGWLDFSDGTRYRVEGGYVVSVRDKNGNMIIYDYETLAPPATNYPSLKRLYRITDSLNREVTITYGNSSVPDQINYKGVSGAGRAIKVQKKSLGEALYPGFQLTTMKELFKDPVSNTYHWHTISFPSSTLYNPEVISSVEYPDGRVMSFQYTNYGELACIRKPSGAKTTYQYGSGYQNASSGGLISTDYFYNQAPPAGARSTSWLLYRRVLEVANYINETTLINRTTISRPEILTFTPLMDSAVTKDVYDASGNLLSKQKHRFYENFLRQNFQTIGMASSQLSRWVAGLEYEVATYSISNGQPAIYKYDEKSWNHGPFGVTPGFGHYTWWDGDIFKLWQADRPRVMYEKTTIVEDQSVSQRNFTYDEYLNTTDVFEYDNSALKRRTHTDFLRVNPVSGVDYRHTFGTLLRLPLRTLIYDPNDILRSKVEFEYDNYQSDGNHASLVDRADISKLCVHFNSGICWDPTPILFRERGNMTAETIYTSAETGGGAISVYKKYDVAGNVVAVKDGLGKESNISYTDVFADGQSRPFATFAFPTQNFTPIPDSSNQKGSNQSLVTSTIYDYETGLVTSVKDANDQTTTTSYTRPDGSPDPFDRPHKITFSDGGWISYEYGDTPGNIFVKARTLRENAPFLQISENHQYYDNFLRPTRSYISAPDTSTNWTATESKYDGLGRAWQVSNPVKVQNSGDALQNADWTTTSFDLMGRPLEITSNDGAKVINAYFGRKVMSTDQAGKTRLTELDGLTRLIKVIEFNRRLNSPYILEEPNATDFASFYEYDVHGKLTKSTLTEPSQTTPQVRTFSYDSTGRLTAATNPETGTTTFTYDNNNNLKTKIDARNIKTEYDYDALNRPTQRRYTPIGSPPANYTSTPTVDLYYDGRGMPAGVVLPNFSKNRLTATKSSVAESVYYKFDNTGRLLSHLQIVDPQSSSPQTFSMEYTYNMAGDRKTIKYPSGKVVATQYDSSGKISGTRRLNGDFYAGGGPNSVNRVAYSAAGASNKVRLGNGKWEHTLFNSRLRPTEIGLGINPTDSSIFKLDYKYGVLVSGQNDLTQDNGNLESQTISVPGQASFKQTYTYDNLNRLDKATEVRSDSQEIWRQGYLYDRFGNRTIDTNPQRTTPELAGASISINPASNRIGTQGYVYDASGNLVEYPQASNTLKFDYDGENKQTNYKLDQTPQAGYFYDGDGRRVKKVVGNGVNSLVSVYVYDVNGQLLTEYSNQPTTTANLDYVTPDHLGTTRIVTKKDGSVRSRHDFLPFGEEIVSLANNGRQNIPSYNLGNVRQKFTGQERDSETGLDFFKSRYYSSNLGRFSSPDEFPGGANEVFSQSASANPTFYADPKNPQTFNKYQYCFNNPLRYIDPTGHSGEDTLMNKLGRYLMGEANPEGSNKDEERIKFGPFRGFTEEEYVYMTILKGSEAAMYGFEWMEAVGLDLGAVEMARQTTKASMGEADYVGMGLSAGNSMVAIITLPYQGAKKAAEGVKAITVTEKGLGILENHLAKNVEFGQAEWNLHMVDRLKSAMAEGKKVTGPDAQFYVHELAEATIMKNRGVTQEVAHDIALAKYSHTSVDLYHPDVIRQTLFDDKGMLQWSNAYLNKWNITVPKR